MSKRLFLIALITIFAGCSGATEENNATTDNAATNNTDANKTTENSNTTNNSNTENQGNSSTTENANSGENSASTSDYAGLVINEVAAAGDPTDWFELVNTSDKELDLTGCTFTDTLDNPTLATFEAGTRIAPGAYLVVEVSDETVGFKLGGDEALGLFAPDGTTIDVADWDEGQSPTGGSFGRAPDGAGDFVTLTPATRGESNDSATPNNSSMTNNMSAGATCGDETIEGDEECDGGQLGDATCEAMGFASGDVSCSECKLDTSACVVATGDVVINEVTSSGDDNIELYNKGAAAADLSGWIIADAKYPTEMGEEYTFADGTMLEPGAFLTLTKDTDHVFGVGKDDTITLYNTDMMVIDQVAIPEGEAEISYCRVTDGEGDFAACSEATFGAANKP